MANITQLTQDGLLIEDWKTINANFNNLNKEKLDASTYENDLQGLKFGTAVVNGTTVLQITVP